MNVSYGGTANAMLSTVVPDVGPYPATLEIGDEQSMVSLPTDDGPFWMTLEERSNNKNDEVTSGSKKREK